MPLSGAKIYKRLSDVPYIRDNEARVFYGSNTSVFKADLVTLERQESFAIKEVKIENARIGADKRRSELRNEIDMLKKCKHPFVIELHDVYQIEDDPWKDSIFLFTSPWAPVFLQRFLDNSTTTGKSALCPWYMDKAIFVVLNNYLDGLAYLHYHGIKHKDIKPDNPLLLGNRDGFMKGIIADLGLSKVYKLGITTTFRSTYQYLAPEQIKQVESTPK